MAFIRVNVLLSTTPKRRLSPWEFHFPCRVGSTTCLPVPPSRFRTPSAAFAHFGSRVYCAPLPTRIHCVSGTWNPNPKTRPRTSVSHQCIHTLRSVPLAGSRSASLRTWPPRRSPGLTLESCIGRCTQGQDPDSTSASQGPKTLHPLLESSWPTRRTRHTRARTTPCLVATLHAACDFRKDTKQPSHRDPPPDFPGDGPPGTRPAARVSTRASNSLSSNAPPWKMEFEFPRGRETGYRTRSIDAEVAPEANVKRVHRMT